MSSNQSGEGKIRKNIIEANLVDCIVALPWTIIPVHADTCVSMVFYLVAEPMGNIGTMPDETLFIDARKMGHLIDRTRRDLSSEDIKRVADTYHAWRGGEGSGEYADVPGFCNSATLDEIRKHGHVLTPGRYVGAEPQEDDGEPFEEKMTRLTDQWREQQAEARRLDAAIEKNLKRLGFG